MYRKILNRIFDDDARRQRPDEKNEEKKGRKESAKF